MKVAWSVDEEMLAGVWRDLSLLTPGTVPVQKGDWILDLGGGNGDFANTLKAGAEGVHIVSTDVDSAALGRALPGVDQVQGDALALPFDDRTFAAVTARAILHHIPLSLTAALRECWRVLEQDGRVVVQEPCSNNALANLARLLFSTERHEEGEEPLDPDGLVTAVESEFSIIEVRRHFVLSYLMPHFAGRAPASLRRVLRAVAFALTRLDEDLLNGSAYMRRRCAYITIIGRKAPPDPSTTV